MHTKLKLVVFLATLCLAATGVAQPPADYQPKPGQEGKDVIWLPTQDTLVEKMLNMAKITSRDFVIDLGSGDGRTVIAAAKRGAKALGIEYNPELVELSKRAAEKEGVGDKVHFVKADLFQSDFSKATVITMFLLPDLNIKLRPRILQLKPGTRVVSNTFTMGEWKADQTVSAQEGCREHCKAYLWIVPAKVGGVWRLKGAELRLKQDYQLISGALLAEGVETSITGRVHGEHLTFTAGDAQYTGRVTSSDMEGVVRGGTGGGGSPWRAAKIN